MSGPADTIRTFINRNPLNYPGSHRDADESRAALDALVAENQHLRDGIEDYLLWEPGRKGHAEAHRKLAALVAGTPSEDTE